MRIVALPVVQVVPHEAPRSVSFNYALGSECSDVHDGIGNPGVSIPEHERRRPRGFTDTRGREFFVEIDKLAARVHIQMPKPKVRPFDFDEHGADRMVKIAELTRARARVVLFRDRARGRERRGHLMPGRRYSLKLQLRVSDDFRLRAKAFKAVDGLRGRRDNIYIRQKLKVFVERTADVS